MTIQIHDPAALGFSAEKLNRINTLNQRYVDAGKLPGFVSLVARRGKIVYLNTCGMRDIADQLPYETDTIVRLYSMTKPIASVALLQLLERSLFSLNDPIASVLPEFAEMTVYEGGDIISAERPITFQQLLTHTAGIGYGSFGDPNPHPVDAMYDGADLFNAARSLDDVVKGIASLPLRYHPGHCWHYSMATDVVGRLVEVLSGQTLGAYVQEHICGPLGMVDSGFAFDVEKIGRIATLYTITPEDPLAVAHAPRTAADIPAPRAHFGGSGMVGTIYDYFRFASCLLNKGELDGVRILGRKTVERMQMNHLTPAQMPLAFEPSEPHHGEGFGLGVSINVDIAATGEMGSDGDYGWGGFAETNFWVDPQEELIAINMTQCIPSSTYPIRKEFRTAVYQALV